MKRALPSVGWPKPVQDQIDKMVRDTTAKLVREITAPLPEPFRSMEKSALAAKPSKYRNVRTPYRSKAGVDRTYDSAKEARYAMMLDADDRVLVWLPQIHIGLPGSVRYVVDFLVIYRDGRIRWVDVKGRDTQASKNKRKQVEAIYRITVELA